MSIPTDRRTFLKTTGLVSASLLLPRSSHAATPSGGPPRPNILFLLVDQWRGSATGYAGDPNVKTPNLDKLAGAGLNFTGAMSVCPVCTPYRASLMTGRFPTSTGMFLNDAYLPENELCMAEILKGAGYATGYIGKWHLDGHGRAAYIPPPRRQGWDYWKVAECCHNYNKSFYYTGTDPNRKFWDGYDSFAQTRDAQAYIASHASDNTPFALFVSYGTPHFPHHTAPEEYKKLYPPEKIVLPPNVPDHMQEVARREAQGYYAHCAALDKCVGDLLGTLEEAGAAKDTIVVFTSDHGEGLGSHGIRPTQKHLPWDVTARVPFLLRCPALQGSAGKEINTPLTTPDILPTLLGLAQVPIPNTIEGDDLSAVVRNPDKPIERAALYTAVAPFCGLGPKAGHLKREYRAIRTARYTYVRDLNGPWLLFDNPNDPHQLKNLVGTPEHAALQQQLDTQLQAELKKHGDEFRDGQYHIDLWGYDVKNGRSISYKRGAPVQSPKKKTT